LIVETTEHKVRERNAIGELDQSVGGGFVRLLLRNDAPEPWEPYPTSLPIPSKDSGDAKKDEIQ
jgi:hypothetical protein